MLLCIADLLSGESPGIDDTARAKERLFIMATSNNADKARETAVFKANAAVSTFIKSSKDHLKVLKTAAALSVLVLVEHGVIEPLNKMFKEGSNHDAEGIRMFIRNIHKAHGWKTERGIEQGPIAFTKDRGWFVRNNDPLQPQIAESKARIVKAGEAGLMQFDTGDRSEINNRAAREFDFDTGLAAYLKRAAKEGTSVVLLKKVNSLIDEHARLTNAEIEEAALATSKALKAAQEKVARLAPKVAKQMEEKEIATPEKQAANA